MRELRGRETRSTPVAVSSGRALAVTRGDCSCLLIRSAVGPQESVREQLTGVTTARVVVGCSSLARARAWPATSPSEPTAFPTSAMTRSTLSAGTPWVARAMYSKERDRSASPARMAMSSPYT